jgi:glycosyltransferase involved in cell wall biosynthesis
LVADKNVRRSIAAFAEVVKERPGSTLTVVGDGPLREDLEATVRDLGLEAEVQFTGMLTRSDVASVLMQSDVFLLLSSTEGFGNAVVEALSVGLPTVVSPIEALKEVAGDHAFYADSADGVVQVILEAGRHRNPHSVHSRIAWVADHFSISACVTKHVDLYTSRLASGATESGTHP